MLPLTFAALAVLTGALVFLRLRWLHLSRKTQTAFIGCAGAILLVDALLFATNWSTSSDHLNAALYWCAIASYEFFILLFTLLRPRWLTTITSAVLILPILSASPFLPLAELFNSAPHTIVSLGHNFTSDRFPWGTGTAPTSGFDMVIYSHPGWTHFFRHRRQGCRYYSGQCDAAQSYATLQPDHKHILMSCPAAPGQPLDTAQSLVVRLY